MTQRRPVRHRALLGLRTVSKLGPIRSASITGDSQSVWPQCLPYTSTNENHWKAGSEEKGACVKNQDVLK